MSTACRTPLGGEGGPPSPKLLPRRRRAGNHRAATSRGFAALPTPHDISGLIAWAKREEWRGVLAELLDRHSAQACAAAGIEMEDITDVLGGDAATVLWGAAFEDLLAADLPDGRNVADDYLRRRGWRTPLRPPAGEPGSLGVRWPVRPAAPSCRPSQGLAADPRPGLGTGN